MNITEFWEQGFLQEANRLFFHPLGLALSVNIGVKTGEEFICSIWDYRTASEGVYFDTGIIDPEKADYVKALRDSKRTARKLLLGDVIAVKNA